MIYALNTADAPAHERREIARTIRDEHVFSLERDTRVVHIREAEMKWAPKAGPQAKVNNGAIHQACGGAERWSRNGGDTRRPTSFGLRWKRLKAGRQSARCRVNTIFIPT